MKTMIVVDNVSCYQLTPVSTHESTLISVDFNCPSAV